MCLFLPQLVFVDIKLNAVLVEISAKTVWKRKKAGTKDFKVYTMETW